MGIDDLIGLAALAGVIYLIYDRVKSRRNGTDGSGSGGSDSDGGSDSPTFGPTKK